MEIAPFLLEPVLKPKPWGGRGLSRLFDRDLPDGEKIGESWELCARPNDSCIVASGPHAGKTLLELVKSDPVAILGADIAKAYDNSLPVLAKFIDAEDWLSIQVHPDDCVARALAESDTGKEEAWLVIEARPGANLVLGTARELTYEKVIELCDKGKYDECLNFLEVEAGDVVAIPPGTLHAIGRGIMLFEVSQNSDLTYRVDDWNRQSLGRELHREKARDIMTCGPPVMAKQKPLHDKSVTLLHEASHFRLFEISPGEESIILKEESFSSLTVFEGGIKIESAGYALKLEAGSTGFIPASAPEITVSGAGRAALILPSPVVNGPRGHK